MDGFLLVCGELDALRRELGRSRLGRALLEAAAPQPLAADQWVVSATLRTQTLPLEMIATPFPGLSMSGRIYADASSAAAGATAISAADKVRAAYREHGRQAQAHLNGEYCFCLLDAQTSTLQASVDLFGVRSLCYLEQRGLWALSDSCSALVALFGATLALNGPAIAGFLVPFSEHCLDRGETFYSGLRILRAGEWLSIDLNTGSSERSRIGLPLSLVESDRVSARQLQRDLGDALLAALRDRVLGDRVALTLSGGIDSAVLATQLSELRRQRPNLEITALTSVLRGSAGESEAQHAELTARALGIDLHRAMRDPGTLPFPVASLVPWAEQPLGLYDNLSQVRQVIALGGAPALSGLGADEVVATAFRRPGLRRSILPRIWRRLIRARLLPRGPADAAAVADLQRLLQSRPPAWIDARWHAGLPLPDLEGQPGIGEQRIWYDLLLPNSGFCADIEAVDNDGLLRSDFSLPYLDHRVVRVLLNPAAAQLDLDRAPTLPAKQVLRRLLRGRVPDAVVGRHKHPAGQPIFERFSGPEVAAVQRRLSTIDRLGDYLRPEHLDVLQVDRPWSTLYPLIAAVSLASWFLHQPGVESQWTTTSAL